MVLVWLTVPQQKNLEQQNVKKDDKICCRNNQSHRKCWCCRYPTLTPTNGPGNRQPSTRSFWPFSIEPTTRFSLRVLFKTHKDWGIRTHTYTGLNSIIEAPNKHKVTLITQSCDHCFCVLIQKLITYLIRSRWSIIQVGSFLKGQNNNIFINYSQNTGRLLLIGRSLSLPRSSLAPPKQHLSRYSYIIVMVTKNTHAYAHPLCDKRVTSDIINKL